MQTFQFIGRVLPNNSLREMKDIGKGSCRIESINERIFYSVEVKDSVLTATCEVENFHEENIEWYLNYTIDYTRAVVNLVGFSCSIYWDIVFDKIVTPDNSMRLLRVENKYKELCKSFSIEDKDKFRSALTTITEPNFFLALNDVLPLLRFGTLDISASYRAIERLKNILSPHKKPSAAWEVLRETLRISRTYLDYIENQTTDKRHGHLGLMSGEINDEILRRTWIIIDRFIAYSMGGSVPLSEKDFPIL